MRAGGSIHYAELFYYLVLIVFCAFALSHLVRVVLFLLLDQILYIALLV